jgi:hypothetical protein
MHLIQPFSIATWSYIFIFSLYFYFYFLIFITFLPLWGAMQTAIIAEVASEYYKLQKKWFKNYRKLA